MTATINCPANKQINPDDLSLEFTTRFDHPIRYYDDGFGPLWIMRDSMGIVGIVRAQTWEDAYSICEDEYFPECDLTMDEIRAEYNHKREHKPIRDNDKVIGWETVITQTDDENGFLDNDLFQEAYGHRPNGPNSRDKINHGIYAKDLNGEALDPLTPELAAHLELKIIVKFA